MSEEIVACPGCGKKFRIPDGAGAPWKFPCTACQADVPYGPPAAQGRPKAAVAAARPAAAARPGAQAPARAAAPARQAAPARAAAAEPARASTRTASRRRIEDEGAPPPKKNNTGLYVGVGIIGVIVVVGLIVMLGGGKKDEPKTPALVKMAPVSGADAATPSSPQAPAPAAPDTAPAPGAPPSAAAPTAGAPAKPEAGAPKPAEAPKAPPPQVIEAPAANLGVPVPSIAGTTEAERSEMDRLVTLAVDFGSGRDGATAESKLINMGKKAIPALLTAFTKQYNGSKWSTESDQYGAWKVQDILQRIVKADKPKDFFVAQFQPGVVCPPDDFRKAGEMWVRWWVAVGQNKDKFKRSDD